MSLLTAGWAHHKKLQTPKAAEAEASWGAPMSSTSTASAVLPPRTNFVYRRTFGWQYPTNELPSVRNFRLYIGQESGSYSIVEDTGTNLTYTFRRTNWTERMDRHFAVVTAQDMGFLESIPSNEIHWPDFPPDHYRLTWQTNYPVVLVYSTTDLTMPKSQWPILAMVAGTNVFEDWIRDDYRFFVIDKAETPTITLFNPNP